MSLISYAKTFALDLLFPILCVSCKAEGVYLCRPCAAAIPAYASACFVCKKLAPPRGAVPAGRTCLACRKKTHIYASFSPFSYDHPAIHSLIHDLKYRRMRGMAPTLGNLVLEALAFYRVIFPKDALIIPVPLHPSRERMRGFNQARLIAYVLGEKLELSVRRDILKKIKKTRPQMELPREERLKNILEAFAVSDTAAVRNQTCILVDDVKTTGATLESATRALKRAGAKRVWALTVAR